MEKKRPLGIPTVRDRVVQMAAKLVLEPIFEADFLPCSYGYRPKRSQVLDADIRDYFGSIDHDKLMKLVARRVSDRRVLKLIKQWLEAGVMEDGELRSTMTGGAAHQGNLGATGTRAAPRQDETNRALRWKAGLRLSRLSLPQTAERQDLGTRAKARVFPASQRAMTRIRQQVKDRTPRGLCHADLRAVIKDLNPILRGWGAYFATGDAARSFNQIDSYVAGRQLVPGAAEKWDRDYFVGLGLHRLRGTVAYPETTQYRWTESSPASRVREIRKHGFYGGRTEPLKEGK